jgi:hypothetical protein
MARDSRPVERGSRSHQRPRAIGPATGSVYPNAYVAITDAVNSLANGEAEVTLSRFATAETAAAGMKPVLPPELVVLTATEIDALRGQFAGALYEILKLRPEWAFATDV